MLVITIFGIFYLLYWVIWSTTERGQIGIGIAQYARMVRIERGIQAGIKALHEDGVV